MTYKLAQSGDAESLIKDSLYFSFVTETDFIYDIGSYFSIKHFGLTLNILLLFLTNLRSNRLSTF